MPRYMSYTNDTNRKPNHDNTTNTNFAGAGDTMSTPKSTKWSALRRMREWVTACKQGASRMDWTLERRNGGRGSGDTDCCCCERSCFGGLNECCGGKRSSEFDEEKGGY